MFVFVRNVSEKNHYVDWKGIKSHNNTCVVFPNMPIFLCGMDKIISNREAFYGGRSDVERRLYRKQRRLFDGRTKKQTNRGYTWDEKERVSEGDR